MRVLHVTYCRKAEYNNLLFLFTWMRRRPRLIYRIEGTWDGSAYHAWSARRLSLSTWNFVTEYVLWRMSNHRTNHMNECENPLYHLFLAAFSLPLIISRNLCWRSFIRSYPVLLPFSANTILIFYMILLPFSDLPTLLECSGNTLCGLPQRCLYFTEIRM
jgi:hypothetical protein